MEAGPKYEHNGGEVKWKGRVNIRRILGKEGGEKNMSGEKANRTGAARQKVLPGKIFIIEQGRGKSGGCTVTKGKDSEQMTRFWAFGATEGYIYGKKNHWGEGMFKDKVRVGTKRKD